MFSGRTYHAARLCGLLFVATGCDTAEPSSAATSSSVNGGGASSVSTSTSGITATGPGSGGAPSSSTSASGGSAGAPSTLDWEDVAEHAGMLRVKLLDDGYIYFTTFSETIEDYTQAGVWTLHRVPTTGGVPTSVATSDSPIIANWADDDDLLVLEPESWDSGLNTWSEAIKRVDLELGTVVALIAPLSVNENPKILTRTDDSFIVQVAESDSTRFRLFSFDAVTGAQNYRTDHDGGWVIAHRASETMLQAVTYYDRLVEISLDSGEEVRSATLPNLCRSYTADPNGDDWFALCGEGAAPYDAVRVAPDGTPTLIEEDVFPARSFLASDGATVYVRGLEEGQDAIVAYDFDTREKEAYPIMDVSPFAVAEGYIYATIDDRIVRSAM